MANWALTVIQCPNGSGLTLEGVQCYLSGVLKGTTDAFGAVTLSEVGTYSLLKAGYQSGTWVHPGTTGSSSTCLNPTGGGGGGTDRGAPSAPSDLVAVSLSSTEIELSWADHAADETEFAVERSPDGVMSWAEIGTVGANTATYTDTGLAAATTYYYRVRARNGTGDSAASNTANATTSGGGGGGGVAVPAAPSELTAEAVSASRIRLEWRDNSGDETGFRVERSADGISGWVEVGTTAANVTGWVNTGLTSETAYYYRVRAYSADGSSSYTNVADATTLAAGAGECTVTPYATVADVQSRIWSTNLRITDSSEPSRADVEDWLCQESHWIDSTLAWRYVMPATHTEDRERLRPACADLVAGRVWRVLVSRNPGHEKRPEELRSAGLISLVYQPGAIRTATSSLGRLATDPPREGRSFLVLPHTALADAGEAELGAPQGTFTEPDGEPGAERLFGAGREW